MKCAVQTNMCYLDQLLNLYRSDRDFPDKVAMFCKLGTLLHSQPAANMCTPSSSTPFPYITVQINHCETQHAANKNVVEINFQKAYTSIPW
jgi:hypothetical protein